MARNSRPLRFINGDTSLDWIKVSAFVIDIETCRVDVRISETLRLATSLLLASGLINPVIAATSVICLMPRVCVEIVETCDEKAMSICLQWDALISFASLFISCHVARGRIKEFSHGFSRLDRYIDTAWWVNLQRAGASISNAFNDSAAALLFVPRRAEISIPNRRSRPVASLYPVRAFSSIFSSISH